MPSPLSQRWERGEGTSGAWIAAHARIAPGVTVGREAVVTLGSTLLHDAEPRGIYTGNPAVKTGTRTIKGAGHETPGKGR